MKAIKQHGVQLLGLAGVGFFLFSLAFGFDLLNPNNNRWLLSGDSGQHFFGFNAYLNTSWSWILGRITEYNAPFGTSLVYTDSIPVLSIFLKMLGVKAVTQFHGIWILFCWVAQLVTGYLFLLHACGSRSKALMGALFIGTLPTYLSRVTGWTRHYTLFAHFLLILSILFNHVEMKKGKRMPLWVWGALLWFELGTHFYFFFFSGMIFVLSRYRWMKFRLPTRGELALIAVLLLSAFGFGYFEIPISSVNTGTLGEFSMNLFSPVSPFLSVNYPEQIEGNLFMGFGLLFLVFSALMDPKNRADICRRLQCSRGSPDLVLFFFVLLYSLSSSLAVGEWRFAVPVTLATYLIVSLFFFRWIQRFTPLMAGVLSMALTGLVYLSNLMARSSGRGGWVLIYVSIYFLFTLRLRSVWIGLALAIQTLSVFPWVSVIRDEHRNLRKIGLKVTGVVEPRLEEALRNARRLVLYGSDALPEGRLTWLALSNRLPIGPSYVARSATQSIDAELERIRQGLLAGSPESGVLIALGDPALASEIASLKALQPYLFEAEGITFVFR
jgi:hypothetical protein